MERFHAVTLALLLTTTVANAADPSLAVSGLVATPLHLTLADLRALPAQQVSATQFSGHGPVVLNCSGPLVTAILNKATLAVGSANNASLGHSVLVTADDGYTVSLSLGELDPNYGNEIAIIATDCSGKPLDAPRLVVPNDKHGGRAVRGVITMEVK